MGHERYIAISFLLNITAMQAAFGLVLPPPYARITSLHKCVCAIYQTIELVSCFLIIYGVLLHHPPCETNHPPCETNKLYPNPTFHQECNMYGLEPKSCSSVYWTLPDEMGHLEVIKARRNMQSVVSFTPYHRAQHFRPVVTQLTSILMSSMATTCPAQSTSDTLATECEHTLQFNIIHYGIVQYIPH